MPNRESDVVQSMDNLLMPVTEDLPQGVELSCDMVRLRESVAADIIRLGVRPMKPGRDFSRRLYRLRTELAACIQHALRLFPSWHSVPALAQRVIITLMFDVGVARFRKSKDFICAVSLHDWYRASAEVMRIFGANRAPEHFSRYARLLRSLSS